MNSSRFGGAAGVGGWIELGRTSTDVGSGRMLINGIANKRYLMILSSASYTNAATMALRFNEDSGTNYSSRWSSNGGADGTATSDIVDYMSLNETTKHFAVNYVSNYQTKEKLVLGHSVRQSTAGATTAPNRDQTVGKWANTSVVIDDVENNSQGGTGMAGELVVLGWDPADTHTDNFWEELASVDLSGGASATLSSGTFTAKKYLWVQCYLERTGSNPSPLWRFNSDSGNNYASRSSRDGGAEDVETSISHLDIYGAAASSSGFINMFIINNSANEKLVIVNHVLQNTAGAGNAPNRGEHVVKWANTSSQITDITCTTAINTFGANSILKVWGSD